jgi:hypothetical protein
MNSRGPSLRNLLMSAAPKPPTIPPELVAELQERAERAARGLIDLETRRIARERMDRMREEFRRKHGEVNLAVTLIREARDDA